MTNSKLSQGYVQIYTGDGKGKTTAALGLALCVMAQVEQLLKDKQ